MSDVTSSKFKSLMYNASWHDVAPRWWIYWMRQRTHHHVHVVYVSSLACPTSVCSDRLPSCSLKCSLAVAFPLTLNTICLSHSVGLHGEETSVAFSRSIGVNFEALIRAQIWNVCICSFNFKFSVYGLTAYTHVSCNAVPLVWGTLRLAPIRSKYCTPTLFVSYRI